MILISYDLNINRNYSSFTLSRASKNEYKKNITFHLYRNLLGHIPRFQIPVHLHKLKHMYCLSVMFCLINHMFNIYHLVFHMHINYNYQEHYCNAYINCYNLNKN